MSTNRTDDRSNVVKSTQIAIKYLKYLHNQLNDWNLALAAYNWGIGNVKKAIKKGLVSNNAINLHKLPRETRRYLIAYHHLNRLIRENARNPDLRKFPNVKYLVSINQSDSSSYLSANKLSGIDNSVLKHINGYDVFKRSDSDKVILIPSMYFTKYFSTDKIAYKKSTSKSGCSNKYYKTKYRDTFPKVARKYKIKMDLLKEMNPQISFLRPGMNVKLCW